MKKIAGIIGFLMIVLGVQGQTYFPKLKSDTVYLDSDTVYHLRTAGDTLFVNLDTLYSSIPCWTKNADTIYTNDYVGIGTSSPVTQLDVNGNLMVRPLDNTNYPLEFNGETQALNVFSLEDVSVNAANDNYNIMSLKTNLTPTGSSVKRYYGVNANLWLGDGVGNYTADVTSAVVNYQARLTAQAGYSGEVGTWKGLNILGFNDLSGGATTITEIQGVFIANLEGQAILTWGIYNMDNTYLAKNVGIGTTVPVEMLEVVGNVKADTLKGYVAGSYLWSDSLANLYDSSAIAMKYRDTAAMLAPYLTSFSESDPVYLSEKSSLQLKSDTSSWDATKTWVQSQGYLSSVNYLWSDSLAGIYEDAVKYSDTGAMLDPYLTYYHETDPVWVSQRPNYYTIAGVLALPVSVFDNDVPYVEAGDTGTMLAPYIPYSDTNISIATRTWVGDQGFLTGINNTWSDSISDLYTVTVKYNDTTDMLSPYLQVADTTAMLAPYLTYYNESDPVYSNDSGNIIWWNDTTTIATKYDLDTLTIVGDTNLWQLNGDKIYYSGGNAGIGITNPVYNLDIVGDVRISDDLKVDSIEFNAGGDKLAYFEIINDTTFKLNNNTFTTSAGDVSVDNYVNGGTFTGGTLALTGTGAAGANISMDGRYVKYTDTSDMLEYYIEARDTAAMLTNYLTDYTEIDPVWVSQRPNYYTIAGVLALPVSVFDNNVPYVEAGDTASWNATRTWVLNQGYLTSYTENDPYYFAAFDSLLRWEDTTNIATQAWVQSQGYLSSVNYLWSDSLAGIYESAQKYSDTSSWDATRTWVQSQGYLSSVNYLWSDSLANLYDSVNIAIKDRDTASMLQYYIEARDTAAMLDPYLQAVDTTAMLSNYLTYYDENDPYYVTDSGNIVWWQDTNRIATKYDLDTLTVTMSEIDPIYSDDSANIIWWQDTATVATHTWVGDQGYLTSQYWSKTGNVLYYNVSGGGVGIGTSDVTAQLRTQGLDGVALGYNAYSDGIGAFSAGYNVNSVTDGAVTLGANLYNDAASIVLAAGLTTQDTVTQVSSIILLGDYIGINTKTPSYDLDVTGDARISDNLTVDSVEFTNGGDKLAYFEIINDTTFKLNNNTFTTSAGDASVDNYVNGGNFSGGTLALTGTGAAGCNVNMDGRYVKYTDTSNMLLYYIEARDTATMLSNYLTDYIETDPYYFEAFDSLLRWEDTTSIATKYYVTSQGYLTGIGNTWSDSISDLYTITQKYSDTSDWDATRTWVQSQGYLSSVNYLWSDSLNDIYTVTQKYSDTANWDATRAWVNSQGYLTSYTENDPYYVTDSADIIWWQDTVNDIASQHYVNSQGFITGINNTWSDSISDLYTVTQKYTDTSDWDATRAWVYGQGYLTDIENTWSDSISDLYTITQKYSDTSDWDATRSWVNSQGYLTSYNEYTGWNAWYSAAGASKKTIQDNDNVYIHGKTNGYISVTAGTQSDVGDTWADYAIHADTSLLATKYDLDTLTVTGDTNIWQQNGDKIYYLDGKVGIGTTNPTADLQVEGWITSYEGIMTDELYSKSFEVSDTAFFENEIKVDSLSFCAGGDKLAYFEIINDTTFKLNNNTFTTSAGDVSVDSYISGGSFNTSTGILSLTGTGSAGASIDLDNKYVNIDDTSSMLSPYLTSFSENDPYYVTDSANTIWWQDTISDIATKYDLDTLTVGGTSFWTANGSDIYYTAGNVGIGLSNPSTALEIPYTHDFKTDTDTSNVRIGISAGYGGYRNLSIGNNAGGQYESTAVNNVCLGSAAGDSLTTGNRNMLIGTNCGQSLKTGARNILVGIANYRYGDGVENVMIGFQAGLNNQDDGNIFIGNQAGKNETNGNLLYIENSDSSDPLIWGDFSSDIINIGGNLGIGTTAPTEKLEVTGNAKVQDMYVSSHTHSDTIRSYSDDTDVVLFGEGTGDITLDDDVEISTNSSEFRVKATKSIFDTNVGIGETAPSQKLHVDGNIYLEDLLLLDYVEITGDGNDPGDKSMILFDPSSTNDTLYISATSTNKRLLIIHNTGANGIVQIGVTNYTLNSGKSMMLYYASKWIGFNWL